MNHFIINLLTFCKPIKNFEDRNLDNINILYNFTRQKEGSLKSELGSPFVHNLYRMVSGKLMLLSQLLSFQGPIFKECMVIKQTTGPQASVKVLGVKEGTQKGVIYKEFYRSFNDNLETESLATPMVKAPKTIHRCILKTSLSTKSSGGQLACHVCLASYSDYNTYFQHLVDR